MKSMTRQTIDTIINLGWAEALRQDGYYRHGRDWGQRGDNYIRVVHLQSGRFNSGDRGSFTFSLSVIFASPSKVMGTKPKSTFPNEFNCGIYEPIGLVLPGRRGKLWEFDGQSDLRAIADECIEAWRGYAKPWLERHSDMRVAREVAIRRSNYLLAIQISILLGEKQEAQRFLEKLLAEYRTEAHHYFLDLAEKHGIVPRPDELRGQQEN